MTVSLCLPGESLGNRNLAISGARPMTAALRSGLATFRLPRLAPGRHRLTVTYPGTAEFEPVGTATTVTVTRKAGKRRH